MIYVGPAKSLTAVGGVTEVLQGFTGVLQGCYKSLKRRHEGDTILLQESKKSVMGMSQDFTRVLHWCS
jgi:hypothetical protein